MGSSSVSEPELLELIQKLRVWKRHDKRAPHKPLLLLVALGQVQQGHARLIGYNALEPKLAALLESYGLPNSTSPALPFWWLQSDGLWEVLEADELPRRGGKKEPLVTALREHDVQAGFPADLYAMLRSRPALIATAARQVLDEHFPTSLHDDLLASVGLDTTAPSNASTRRDPAFREQVLQAYEYQCAICGLRPMLGGQLVGLEAAHVQFKSHGGPCTVDNGLALCPTHHKLFDLGAFGLSEGRKILVSSRLVGGDYADDALLKHHGSPLRGPQHGHAPVARPFRDWHYEQVFKRPPRTATTTPPANC